ncbi:MAG TPA: hypothetical protein DCG52_01785 [Alphaproteobacteria bacterium]|nr:hypothetical protein [Alphaproteobacteria bacterium]|tara:strand:+ start:3484 stop:3999 length:516 start_codon:yes stop_codon:yes gene_type:complete
MNNSSKKYQSQSELEEQLILKHYGLAVSQALRFIGNDKQLLEDYIQVGLIGLLKAVRKYDKNRSKFSTFATTCIKNELINFVNRSLKRDKKINVIYNSDLLSTLSEKYVADPTDCFETINDLFTEEQRFIITKKIQNIPDEEISQAIGCSNIAFKDKIRDIIDTIKGSYAR